MGLSAEFSLARQNDDKCQHHSAILESAQDWLHWVIDYERKRTVASHSLKLYRIYHISNSAVNLRA